MEKQSFVPGLLREGEINIFSQDAVEGGGGGRQVGGFKGMNEKVEEKTNFVSPQESRESERGVESGSENENERKELFQILG